MTTIRQSVSKPCLEDMRVGKPEPYAPGKDFDDWESSETVGDCGDGDATTRTAVCNATAHAEGSTEDREESWKQRCRSFYRQLCLIYGNSDHEGSTGLFAQIMTYKFGSRIDDVEDRLNDCVELVRRYDEANGTGPISDHMNYACIISNTLEPWKTQVQQNVGKLGNFKLFDLRSRRIFKATSA